MIRVTTYYGAQHIGVSASEYEKLTGKDVNLSEREILVGIEDSEYQKEKKITDEDYLNTYSFLFTGKYQEDMAEISHRSAVPVRYQGHIYPECDRTVFYRSVA